MMASKKMVCTVLVAALSCMCLLLSGCGRGSESARKHYVAIITMK